MMRVKVEGFGLAVEGSRKRRNTKPYRANPSTTRPRPVYNPCQPVGNPSTTLNPKPQALNTQTLNPQPSTLNRSGKRCICCRAASAAFWVG